MENIPSQNHNDFSIKESNYQESDHNSSITMSISISMEGQAKRNKENRIKSIKFANELKILEKITHDTSDRNISDPHENSDLHFINMINLKNLIYTNFDRGISSFERVSISKEKEIIDLMFALHYLKEELEDIDERLNNVQSLHIKHTRNHTSNKAELYLNQSHQSNISSSRRSYSNSSKSPLNKCKIVGVNKNLITTRDKFGVFLPKVCINIASDTNSHEMPKINLKEGKIPPVITDTDSKFTKQAIYTGGITTTTNLKKAYPRTTPIKARSDVKRLDIASKSASNHSSNKSTKDTSTIIAKNTKKIDKNHSSNKSSNKNSNTTSCSTINKFLSINERKSSNKLSNEHIKRITYKLEPKKKSENFREKVENFINSGLAVDSFYHDSCLGSICGKSYPIKILDLCSNGCESGELKDVNKIENKFYPHGVVSKTRFVKLFNEKKNKIIFSNIFSFLNIKNKLKNMNRILRLTFVECQIKKVEEMVKDENQLIEKAKLNRKSNLLELILEMEILSHRESKLKAILNYYKFQSDN